MAFIVLDVVPGTSYHHRNSSALYPAQRMEQEVYYDSAEAFTKVALSYAEIIGSLFILYNQYTASLTTAAANTIDAIKMKANKVKEQINNLLFVLSWVRSYTELSILYAEDLTVYIRRRNHFHPKRYRTVDSISHQDCDIWFGLSKHDLRRLLVQW